MSTTGRRILLNTLSQYAMRGLGVVLSFVLVPFLVRHLGIELFGLLLVLESFTVLADTALGGWRAALARHATVALSQGPGKEFERYLSTGRVLFRWAALALLVLGGILAWTAPMLFRFPEGSENQARMLMAFFAVSVAASMLNSVYWAGLYAKERFDKINAAVSGALVLRALLLFTLFSVFQGRMGIALYGLIHLGVTLAQCAGVTALFYREFPSVRLSGTADPSKRSEVFSFGSYTFIANAASAMHDNVAILIVNIFRGPAANALFGIGMKFPDLLYSVFNEPAWALTPTVTAMAARGEKAKLKELLFFFTKVMVLACVPACLILSVFAREILSAWVGSRFESAWPVMVFWTLSLMFSAPCALCDVFPNAYGRVRLRAAVCSGAVLLSLALYWAIAVAGGGLGTIAAAGSVVGIAYSAFFSAPYACRLAGFSTAEYWMRAYFSPALFAGGLWGVFSAIILFAQLPFYSAAFAAAAAVFSAVYIWAVFRFALTAGESSRLLSAVQSLRRKQPSS